MQSLNNKIDDKLNAITNITQIQKAKQTTDGDDNENNWQQPDITPITLMESPTHPIPDEVKEDQAVDIDDENGTDARIEYI